MLVPLVLVVELAVAQGKPENADALCERELGAALADLEAGKPEACARLERVSELFWDPGDDRLQWPRVLRRQVPARLASAWRAAVDACVARELESKEPKCLLTSALLHDDALRAKAVARGDEQRVPRGGGVPTAPRPRISEEPDATPPVVLAPGLAAEFVGELVHRYRAQLTYCYERQLRERPSLQGTIDVEFTVTKEGKLTDVVKVGSTIDDPSVEVCVLSRMEKWPFPSPKKTEPRVRSHFVFRPLAKK